MKIRSPILTKTAALLGSALIRSWMSTLDCRVAYYDPRVDPPHPEWSGRKIYIFWHEYILLPLFYRGHNNLAMLLSQHGDADILERLALHFGFDGVRGSSKRGGAAALRELSQTDRNIAITPDGPRGPRRVLAQGPIYLASTTGLPLVLMGFGYDRPWRLGSWDRFAVPRPYSRARSVVSPEIHIPPNLDRAGIEHHRVEVEQLLNRLTLEAEAWAESGTHKLGEQPARREFARRPFRRVHRAHGIAAPHARASVHA